MDGETVAPSQALWDAVNAYTAACGGDIGDGTIGGARMDAVAAIERAVSGVVQARLEEAARVTLVDLAAADVVAQKLLAREALRSVPGNLRAEVLRGLRAGAAALEKAADEGLACASSPACGLPGCEACDAASDPRPEWQRTAAECRETADRLEAAPAGTSPLVVEAVRLAMAAPYGRGAEERDVVDLVSGVLKELFELRGREGRHVELLELAAGHLLSATEVIENELGDDDGECWDEYVFADHLLEHVAKTQGQPYQRPDRGPRPGSDDSED